MIDTLSLLLSHMLMFLVAFKLFLHPDVNEEIDSSRRHFKQIRPRAKATEDTRGKPRA